MATELDLVIEQGRTFRQIVRWKALPLVYKPITGISVAGPAVVTCAAHGVPDGWEVAIASVLGMTEINAKASPPKSKDYMKAKVLSAGSLELNLVNAAGFTAYQSGGYVIYYTPVPLAGYTGRMTIKTAVGGTVLATLTDANGGVVVDDAAKTITLLLTASETEAFTWTKGVYDLELVKAPDVVALLTGKVKLTKEVTTTV